MFDREGIEVDGKRYISAKVAGNWWRVKPATVSNYCKNDEIPGAFQDRSKRWCIPIDAVKPFPKSTIRQVLRLTIQLQANRKLTIDYNVLGIEPCNLGAVYCYLSELGFLITKDKIVSPNDILRGVELTDKGWAFAFSDETKKEKFKMEDATKVVQLATALASMAKVFSGAA